MSLPACACLPGCHHGDTCNRLPFAWRVSCLERLIPEVALPIIECGRMCLSHLVPQLQPCLGKNALGMKSATAGCSSGCSQLEHMRTGLTHPCHCSPVAAGSDMRPHEEAGTFKLDPDLHRAA